MRLFTATFLLLALFSGVALAVPVNPGNSDEVAAWIHDGSEFYVLRTTGEIWWINPQYETEWRLFSVLPVPIAQVVDWQKNGLRTNDGIWWWREVGTNDPSSPWHPVPPLPFGPVAGKQQSIGSVKRTYR